MQAAEDERVAKMYCGQLANLKLNSKPLINSLTMIAEDHLKSAPIIVQTIERQLMDAKPGLKLPILYLIDSIVKNVKRDYIQLFTQNIVSIFCSVFEKVDDSTRRHLWKLRETWNDVFSSKKLYGIDVKINQLDPNWPVVTPTPNIHVNPKFLAKAALVLPNAKARSNTYELLPALPVEPVDEATEAQMREQLLIKQKELIDLQQKKLELELMHAKAKLEEQERIKKLQEGVDKQQQLMKQAEMAKQHTDMATSLMALARKSNPAKSSSSKTQGQAIKEPFAPKSRKDTSSNKSLELDRKRTPTPKSPSTPSGSPNKHSSSSSSSVSSSAGLLPAERKSRSMDKHTTHAESKSEIGRENQKSEKSLRDAKVRLKEREMRKQRREKGKEQNAVPTIKEALQLDKAYAMDSVEPNDRKDVSPSKSAELERKRTPTPKSPSTPRGSPTKRSSSPSTPVNSSVGLLPIERKSKSREKHTVSIDIGSEVGENSGSNRKAGKPLRDAKVRSKEREVRKQRQEKEKEQYANRKSAVLSRNYRKRQDSALVTLDDENLTPENARTGDVDLRFENDVDLRRQPEDDSGQPKPKKPRNSGALIDDLFGEEDVDLRQSSSSWSQVKKPSSSPISAVPYRSHDQEEMESSSTSLLFNDIRDPLQEDQGRPPSAVSPTNSVCSTRSSCDPLGRPLLFARLPDDPEERKRSLDSRSSSIDPVEQFCSRYIDKPSMRIGGLTKSDLGFAFTKAKQELDAELLTGDHYNMIVKRLVQVNELHKINEFKQARTPHGQRGGPGPNPWLGNQMWQPPRQNFGPRGANQNRFPGHGQNPQWNSSNPWTTRPRGPNPFLEALPRPPDDLIPETNPVDLMNAERDVDSSIPLDKIPRKIRFYGETAIVFLGMLGNEPYEISFQKSGPPKTVYIDKEPFKCSMGASQTFYIDKVKHVMRIGTPKRELYIDGQGYPALFGGPHIPIKLGTQWHNIKLDGPPPQVEVGDDKRYDLVAGLTTLFIDSSPCPIFLDEKPQILDFCGFPVILKFSEDFFTVTLNGRPFPTRFGGNPMSITLPNGQQHFLRFAAVSPPTEEAMHRHVKLKQQQSSDLPGPTVGDCHFGPPFRGRGGYMRTRGNRGISAPRVPGPGFVPLSAQLNRAEPAERVARNQDEDFRYMDDSVPSTESNALDMVATFLPHSSQSRVPRSQENAYESDTSFREENNGTEAVDSTTQSSGAEPLSVDDLLTKLLMAGILKGTSKESGEADKKETKSPSPSPEMDKKVTDETHPTDADSTTIQPLETVDIVFSDNMKERRTTLIDQICTGIQCASCGLRFAPDQTSRYTQHLDWHFRQNRREKGNSRKALSRKWYYDLSDWIQFEEIEDLEERAASMFEFQEETEGEERSTGTILNPDSYTVRAAGHEGALCPQCGEEFETFYEEEEEEWRLRDALLSPESEGESKLYHPICHQDYIASLQQSSLMDTDNAESFEVTQAEPQSASDSIPPPPEDDEDEVLIIKEGKKDVVLMEIDVEDDEPQSNDVNEKKEPENGQILKHNSETESNNVEPENNMKQISSLPLLASLSSQSILSPILIHDDDESSASIPGILTGSEVNGGVFGFALGLDSNQSQSVVAAEEPERISYNSWQFDFPKIKVEPPEWDDVAEDQVIMSKEYQVQENSVPMELTLDEDSHQGQISDKGSPAPLDIDLTEEDEITSASVGSLVAQIDGNLDFKGDALQPVVAPNKIRINIAGLNAIGSSSPRKGSPTPTTPDENSKDSPKRLDCTDSGPVPSSAQSPKTPELDPDFNLEEMKRLKPRLVGRKLVNCPPKTTGKEVSGLCVIC